MARRDELKPPAQLLDVTAIAQNDQFDDEFVVGREVKGQSKRVRQIAFVKVSITLAVTTKLP
jgi:hypothetical protein